MNDLTKNILLWVVIVLVLLAVFSRYMPTVGQPEEVRYSTFLDDVKANRVDSVVLQGEMIYGSRKDKTQFKTFNPETDYTALIGTLEKSNVAIEGRPWVELDPARHPAHVLRVSQAPADDGRTPAGPV